jgi:hypothetical protein
MHAEGGCRYDVGLPLPLPADLDPLLADHDRATDGHPPPNGERGGQLWWSGGSGTGSAKPVPVGVRDRTGDGADSVAVGEDVPGSMTIPGCAPAGPSRPLHRRCRLHLAGS